MSGTKWTAEQIDFLRRHYSRKTAEAIGRRIGKTKAATQQKAAAIGLTKARPLCWWRGEFLQFLSERAEAGKLDGEIAADWNETNSPRVDRRTVAYCRKAAGIQLTAVQQERLLQIRKQSHRRQLEVLGVQSFCQLWRRHVRLEAISAGWPLDCSKFEVSVLNLLSDGRRWTRRDLSAALGRKVSDQRDQLKTRKGSGSVLANLIRRGLVCKSQGRPVRGVGKGRSLFEYWLTRQAVDYHARHTRRRCG